VSRLLEGSTKGVRQAAIRRVLEGSAAELHRKAAEVDPTHAKTLMTAYASISKNARRTPHLLSLGDVAIAEAAPHLRQSAPRLALRQLAEAHEAIAQGLPAVVTRRRTRAADVATSDHDESTYPMGGFSSMTNSGSLENVVTSELVYSTDGDPSEDPFTIRWAMGELLYYARDESLAHRRRMALWIDLHPTAFSMGRVKDADAPWQRLVHGLAAITLFVERAIESLRSEALSIRIVVPTQTGAHEERALLALRMREGIARGVVELIDRDVDKLATDTSVADVIRFELTGETQVRPPRDPKAKGPADPWSAALGASPTLLDPAGRVVSLGAPRTSAEAWAKVVHAWLAGLA
jgi:hypothetical protein